MTTLNPDDAPEGYVAVECKHLDAPCEVCAFGAVEPLSDDACNHCGVFERDDGCSVIFVRRDAPKAVAPAAPADPVVIPHEWRSALRKLAFMARTGGGTAGPDSGLMAACAEAEALLSKPYLPAPTAAPTGEPVALLWQAMKALKLAAAICDAVPNREPGHLGTLVNAQPDGRHGYRTVHDAAEALRKYLTEPTARSPAPSEPVAQTFDAAGFRAWIKRELPDDTIIGQSDWWADHLTVWAQRFVKAQPVAQEPVAYRYKDARGHWRYVGAPFTPGWDMPPNLKHEPLYAEPAVTQELMEMSPEFTDTARAALLWVLWHHQGHNSPVGQPIRFALGMGRDEHLNDRQIAEAKRWEALPKDAVTARPKGTSAPVERQPLTLAATDVLAERRRQVEAEGWTPEHDDAHGDGSLGAAAACYAATQRPDGMCPAYWPWKASWWKPKDRRSDLVRAGALILAEIERLDRAGGADKIGGE